MLLGKWAALLAVVVVMEGTAAFPSPLLIRKVGEEAALDCTGAPGEKVEWQHEGRTQPESGRHFSLHHLDIPYAGNYSCWAESRLLHSVYVAVWVPEVYLIDEREGEEGEPAITCWAPSYSGILNCSWKSLHQATFQVHLRRTEPDAALCPSVEVAVPGNKMVHILLEDCSFCPYAEETPLVLVLKGLAEDGGYTEVRKTFFLREIVKPDAPSYLSIVGQRISWAPPVSWNLPAAYFPLQYNLRLESSSSKEDLFIDGLELTTKQENWQKGWIRCQDRFMNSAWSSWREWV
ncbi:interleukin-12 subunit beta-like [Python bivittatus]|uniref:Interleukin-12 subunit beta n=1 Tax=Python bivittatus TaxID=176946 RepID=A0A9F5J125_PYTBI|nr:interleukin-12 subunit beta-like [Python bivittatus]